VGGLRWLRGRGILRDGLVDEKVCKPLRRVIRWGKECGTRRGVICVRPTGTFDPVYEALGSAPKVHRGEAEQNDTAVFFGGKLMLKVYRKLEAGIRPDIEVRRFLAGEAGFQWIPLL